MKVRLTKAWFAPTSTWIKPKTTAIVDGKKKELMALSGRLYKPGIYEFPVEFEDILPKRDVEYLDPDFEEVLEDDVPVDITAFDHLRDAADAEAEVAEKAEEQRKKEERKAILAKARAAKAAKKDAEKE